MYLFTYLSVFCVCNLIMQSDQSYSQWRRLDFILVLRFPPKMLQRHVFGEHAFLGDAFGLFLKIFPCGPNSLKIRAL